MLNKERLSRIINRWKIWKQDTKIRVKNRIRDNFINQKIHTLIADIRNIHTRLLTTTEDEVQIKWTKTTKNPYQMFFAWLLEYIGVMGISITIVMMIVFKQHYGWNVPLMPIGYGLLVWIILLLIKKIKESITE